MDAGSTSGIFCLGPSDPWDRTASANLDPVVYWLHASIFENAPSHAHMLRTQVSGCPLWAFGTPTYVVHYLVHCLL